MANKRANTAAGAGLLFSLGLLATPAAPLALLSFTSVVVARVCRKMMDDNIEREERASRKEVSTYNPVNWRSEDMNYFPLTPYKNPNEVMPYNWLNTPTIYPTSPETEIASIFPARAAKVLERKFLFQTSVDLANSESVTEFARQGRGSHVRITHRTGFLGLKVDQIDFHISPD